MCFDKKTPTPISPIGNQRWVNTFMLSGVSLCGMGKELLAAGRSYAHIISWIWWIFHQTRKSNDIFKTKQPLCQLTFNITYHYCSPVVKYIHKRLGFFILWLLNKVMFFVLFCFVLFCFFFGSCFCCCCCCCFLLACLFFVLFCFVLFLFLFLLLSLKSKLNYIYWLWRLTIEKIMPLLLALVICKNDENSHQEFMRKEISQLCGYSQLHPWYFDIKTTTCHFLIIFNLQLIRKWWEKVLNVLRW